MRATLLLNLSDAWVDERQYAAHLIETLERVREVAFVDPFGNRERTNDGHVYIALLATFDYENETHYAERLLEVVEYARELWNANVVDVQRGDGQASDGHLG